jgi:hypothetical protein
MDASFSVTDDALKPVKPDNAIRPGGAFRGLRLEPQIDLSRTAEARRIVAAQRQQVATTSNEGMPDSEEGVSHSDHNRFGQVERARG